MSSNIKVQRVCKFCGKEFTARTTVTQYCGDNCAKRAYKARKRSVKIDLSNVETKVTVTKPIELLKAEEFLNVRQVSRLIGCSRPTVYNLIKTGKLKAVNLLKKKTIIRRSEVDKLFEQPVVFGNELAPLTEQFGMFEFYTLTEVQVKYGVSGKALDDIINRNSIPKFKKGAFAFVPKPMIDKLFT